MFQYSIEFGHISLSYLTRALVLSSTTFLCSVVRGLRFTDNFPLTLFRPLFLYGEGVTCNLVNYKCVDQHKTFITSSPSLSRSYKKFSIKQKNNCDSSYIKYLTLLSWPSTWSKQITNCDLSHEKFTMNNKASCLEQLAGWTHYRFRGGAWQTQVYSS